MLAWVMNLGFAATGTVSTGPLTIADTKGKLVLIMAGLLPLLGGA